jgi:long-chain fatty acid transport protein
MIPAVAAINKINENMAWGLALYGVGGMGVDYRQTSTSKSPAVLGKINDSLMLMRMSIPLAYATNGFSVGIAPVIEYGLLAMNSGVTSDIALGFEVGAAYEIEGISLGLDYKSAVTHDFEHTFNSNISDATGRPNPDAPQSKLDTPSVLGLGVSYKIDAHTIALDYKLIGNSSAKGFEDFGWEDQSVFALGYEFAASDWAARVGFNYGKSPLPTDITGTATGHMTTFGQVSGSLMQFPAVTETHITLGGSYNINEQMSVDLAYMYATGSQTVATPNFGAGAGKTTATNDQNALTAALNYDF